MTNHTNHPHPNTAAARAMCRKMTAKREADALRTEAAAHDAEAAASFDRCDTDGFVSQWANTITASRKRAQADIVADGGRATFPALFDLEGNLVAAKLVSTRYGMSWALLANDDPRSAFVGWVNPSTAATAAKRNAAMMRKGYTEGLVMAPAKADIVGSGKGLAGAASCYVATIRTDGGFSRDVTIVSTVETDN